MQNLAGKTALITGGAGGIGLGMAKAFARAGVRIALADLDHRRLKQAESVLRGLGAEVTSVILNVVDASAWRSTLDRVEDQLGPIAILCNNAGIGISGKVWTEDPERWWRVFDVNVRGPFLGCRMVLPRMLARGEEGHIINTASISGLRGNPGMSAYDASKHALVGLSDTLRGELEGTPIGVSILYPGITATGFVANSEAALDVAGGGERDSDDGEVAGQIAMGMSPEKIGERVLRAIQAGEYHIFSHADWKPYVAEVFADRLAAFADNADPDFRDNVPAMLEAAKAAFDRM